MATVREGDQGVLLVVDVQAGVMDGAWEASRIVANVARIVASARARDVPVVWVQHENDELAVGRPAWRWVPELVPASHEPLVRKRFNSAFEDTTLEAKLAGLGATRIVLAGADSSWAIRATANGALDRGYDVTLRLANTSGHEGGQDATTDLCSIKFEACVGKHPRSSLPSWRSQRQVGHSSKCFFGWSTRTRLRQGCV